MSQLVVARLFAEFLTNYDASGKDAVWKNQSAIFRQFWTARILTGGAEVISDNDCDEIIRILDRNGKGNTPATEAVARVMVPQGKWRRMLNEFRTNSTLRTLLDTAFREADLHAKAKAIDQLYAANAGVRNSLTGASGNTINAYLAAYDPFNNLSVVSLNDRASLMRSFGVRLPADWDRLSIGRRMVQSNALLLRDGFHALGVPASARTYSEFCYKSPFKALWRGEHPIRNPGGGDDISVTVPTKQDDGAPDIPQSELRESLQIQGHLAEIGARMGLHVWLPPSDRARILKMWDAPQGVLLDKLPLNYDDATLGTIAQIDVLWLKRRSIVRAFEVEHTTAVYSGLLRMADLLALQPNLNIKLHIVAPTSKREKVFREIRRPVFALLDTGALSDVCTYLSYDSVDAILALKHLDHLSSDVVEEYEEQSVQ